jgi:hypothetical protein
MDLINNEHVLNLSKILQQVGENIEGNLICDIYPYNFVISRNLSKIKNLTQLSKGRKKICEIGVNACHSLLIMLLENPDAEYLLFDLNNHKYTEPCIDYIKKNFTNTKIDIIYGDSINTLKNYINNNSDKLNTYDLCHIDGCHLPEVFIHDFENIKKLSSYDGCVIFDDYDYTDIKNFVDLKVNSKEIIEISQPYKTDLHFIYRYNNKNGINNIDKIFVINLDIREDRLRGFLEETDRIGLSNVERFSAIYKPKTPCLGCTLSHLEVIKIAKERSYKNIIVFEDDFQFLVSSETFYKNLEELFCLNIDFKVVMLAYGCNSSNTQTKVNDLISTTTDASNASGYIVNESCYDDLIECLTYGAKKLEETGEHWNYINDQVWKKLQGDKWFIFNERIGKQRPSYSELSGCYKYPEN